MLYDTNATSAAFANGRPPEDIFEILEWAQQRIDPNRKRVWSLISARKRLGKILFEIEETTPAGPRRLIGKLGKTEGARTLFDTLVLLRRAGFEPPARLTVPEPIGVEVERGFILMEKAPGEQVSDVILERGGAAARRAAESAALWLSRLHSSNVSVPGGCEIHESLRTWAKDLANAIPSCAGQIMRIAAQVGRTPFASGQEVPSHGDFHPMNIFVSGCDRVTAIDMDKFLKAPAEYDIAAFLMQTAAFGYFKDSSFDYTAEARRAFLEAYQSERGQPVRGEVVGALMASAFLKNLHFELVLLDTGKDDYVEPWLWGAETVVFDHNILLQK